MSRVIDCLFIGHNDMIFTDYEKIIRASGIHSGAYRDLNLSFINYKNDLYTLPEIFNFVNEKKVNKNYEQLSLSNVFSLTIAYLGSFLHRRGFSFEFVNSFQDCKEELRKILTEDTVLTIAIPTTLYVAVYPILEIVSFIKKYNTIAKIIIGGPFVSNSVSYTDDGATQYVFKIMNADFYIYSAQGEVALAEIVRSVKEDSSYEYINNVFYRKNNAYHCDQFVEEKNKLEENAIQWELFENRLGRLASVRTTLSCPFECSFCEYPKRAGKYYTISINNIEKELDQIDSFGKVKNLMFIDDTFNVPPERFKEILRLLIRKNYGFSWYSYFRCQFADRETVELMKQSGCDGVILGIESANQTVLNNMNKHVTVEQYQKGLSLLNEYGITTHASFIIGFPGETEDSYMDTVNFIKEYKPTFYRTQIWYCSTLAPIWSQKNKYGIKGSGFEWSHATMDSSEACNLMERMFLDIKSSVWVPQYDFDFSGIVNLLKREYSLEQIKLFLECFNDGVRKKIISPDNKEVDDQYMKRIKELL
ncbi:MAG: PhpK family radical SAM P-methyltransferase [Herbinix sp.]|nr:PhpK family radical SAM P-methyltransferase [Herbinix sp.]